MTTKRYRDNLAQIDWSGLKPWNPKRIERLDRRSHLSAPSVVADAMEPVQSMLDGKMYDSKRRLRQTYREAGVTETGDELPKAGPRIGPDEKAIDAAVDRALSQTGFGA